MPRPTALAPLALIIGAALTLTACSSGPASTEKLTYEDSPLQKYLGVVYGQLDEDDQVAQQNETEELVAQCMTEEGFEYIPVDQSQYMSFDQEDRETLEWVSTYGYAANLTPEEQEELYGGETEYEDPNQEYVGSLSESEMTEYYAVLYGEQPSEEEMNEDGSYEYTWENGGCYGWAQHEITGDQAYEQDQFKEIFEDINALYEEQQKDPALKELNAKWASCMADAGFEDFKLQFDAAQSIYDQQNEFWENDTTGEGPTEEQTKEWRAEEMKVAVADFECREKTDYTNASLKIQFDLEEEFIAENKAALDEMVAFAEENRK